MRLIYLSPVPWHSFSQRPHELVRFFHFETGGQVLWIDPYPTRFPKYSDLSTRTTDPGSNSSLVPTWMEVIRPKFFPIEPFAWSGYIHALFWTGIFRKVSNFVEDSSMIGIGKPSELAMKLLSRHKNVFSFYDAMDDFPAFYQGRARTALAWRQRQIAQHVRVVLTSSTKLKIQFEETAKDVRLVYNGCAAERFPTLLKKEKTNKSCLTFGYVGTVAQWFDWTLVVRLAKSHPNAKFRIIGPIYCDVPNDLPANVFLESPVPHEKALEIMSEFDVGLIPFKKTELTSAVDPIKYYEYRSLGLPVISSDFGEMAFRGKLDHTYLIRDVAEVTDAGRSAMAMQSDFEEIQEFRNSNSWHARFRKAKIFSLALR